MVDDSPDDARIVALIASGDRGALGSLYDRYASLLMAVSMKILRSKREAEDLVHDVFLEIWQRAGDFDPRRGSVKVWLLVRMRSRCLDRVRSVGYARVAPMGERSEELLGAIAARGDVAAESTRLRGALIDLPDSQREVLYLGYFEGLTSSEIAERLDIPVGTVKSRVAAALGKLRKALGGAPEGVQS
ncbi:MAG: sigma-70 family RNA polymerase sigma factor [Deltaproteobacteria bacterium]|nr:sigma-70 family RNA polymerase sigma factor [Deltaproteobacteria bacterium]